MKRLLCLLSLLSLAVPTVRAQAPVDLQPRSRQLAEELLLVMNVDETMKHAADVMLSMQMENNPALQPFEDVLRGFMERVLAWEAVKDIYIDMYAAAFTDEEMDSMIAFYGTEVGQKAVRVTPDLMQKGAEAGQRIIQENAAELEELVRARMNELQAQQDQNPPPPAP